MEFLPSASVLITFSLAAAVVIIAPGPDMTLFLGKTLSQGRRAGIVSYLGATAGLFVHTFFAAFGLSALLAASAEAFTALKIVGALYLLWLAIDAIRNGSALDVSRDQESHQRLGHVFLTGVGINLLNPKIILFFVTFLPQFVSAGDPNAAAKMTFLGVYFIALAVPFCLAVIVAADRIAETVKRSPVVTRIMDWVFASVFASFAVRLLLEPSRD
ncbi:MAG: LysE family translocator [Hyphomicrobiaceae bacterium]|nr:LysE family translocator [Hyphomicrobiaceae bacterium]